VSAGADPPLSTGEGRPVPSAAIHPAAVIAWAGLDADAPLPDGGVGLAIDEGFLSGALILARGLAPALPAPVTEFLERSGAGFRERGAPEVFLEAALRDCVLERSARASLRAGRWEEATASLAALLSAEPPSALSGERRAEWSSWRDRARRLQAVTRGFFARPPSPVDAVQGEALTLTYSFGDPRELADFRYDPQAIGLNGSALLRAARPLRKAKAAPAPEKKIRLTEPIDTLALFAPPLVVQGRWTPSGRGEGWIAVGFAGRFVAFGAGSGCIAWRGELGDGLLPEDGAPAIVEGSLPFKVEISLDRALAESPDGRQVQLSFSAAPAPEVVPPGRLTIGLPPGARLDDLTITGILDPLWAEERLLELQGR
jgi:hypothetical protein